MEDGKLDLPPAFENLDRDVDPERRITQATSPARGSKADPNKASSSMNGVALAQAWGEPH